MVFLETKGLQLELESRLGSMEQKLAAMRRDEEALIAAMRSEHSGIRHITDNFSSLHGSLQQLADKMEKNKSVMNLMTHKVGRRGEAWGPGV